MATEIVRSVLGTNRRGFLVAFIVALRWQVQTLFLAKP
jgi:hypothetical protein